jgi:release factor glutamine methyltransferase
MKIKEALRWANAELVDTLEPNSSATVLLSDVLDLSRTELMASLDAKLTQSQLAKYKKYIVRRKNHEPVWQIIGKVNFWGLEYFVTKDVLVPRPETELLVEKAIQQIIKIKHQKTNLTRNSKLETQNTKISILDIGTGSGTIIISLAHELQNKKTKYYIPDSIYNFVAADISDKALKIAKKNARHNKVKNTKFLKSNLFQNIPDKYDMICANLPYIPTEDIASLDFDVHHYEPKVALDGGIGGLEIYENFFKEVGNYLNDEGVIICEIGLNQGREIRTIVKKYLPAAKCSISKDLAEIDRIAIIEIQE